MPRSKPSGRAEQQHAVARLDAELARQRRAASSRRSRARAYLASARSMSRSAACSAWRASVSRLQVSAARTSLVDRRGRLAPKHRGAVLGPRGTAGLLERHGARATSMPRPVESLPPRAPRQVRRPSRRTRRPGRAHPGADPTMWLGAGDEVRRTTSRGDRGSIAPSWRPRRRRRHEHGHAASCAPLSGERRGASSRPLNLGCALTSSRCCLASRRTIPNTSDPRRAELSHEDVAVRRPCRMPLNSFPHRAPLPE